MPVLTVFAAALKQLIAKNNFRDLKIKKYLPAKMVDNHIN